MTSKTTLAVFLVAVSTTAFGDGPNAPPSPAAIRAHVESMHYPTLATLARVNVRIALEVANESSPPKWNAGDFFGTRFGTPAVARD